MKYAVVREEGRYKVIEIPEDYFQRDRVYSRVFDTKQEALFDLEIMARLNS